jgi:hypothetical protein
MNTVFELSEDEKASFASDSAGLNSDVLRVYLRGFKMTILDNGWNNKKCKTSAKHFVPPADARCAIRVSNTVGPAIPAIGDDSKKDIREQVIDVGTGIRDPRNDPESYRLCDLATTYMNFLPASQRTNFRRFYFGAKQICRQDFLDPKGFYTQFFHHILMRMAEGGKYIVQLLCSYGNSLTIT